MLNKGFGSINSLCSPGTKKKKYSTGQYDGNIIEQLLFCCFSYKTAVQVQMHSGQQQGPSVAGQLPVNEFNYRNVQPGYKRAVKSTLSKPSLVKNNGWKKNNNGL